MSPTGLRQVWKLKEKKHDRMGIGTQAILFGFSYFNTESLTSETGLHKDKTNVNNHKERKILKAETQVSAPRRQRPFA